MIYENTHSGKNSYIMKVTGVFLRMLYLQVVGIALKVYFLPANPAGDFLQLACAIP